MYFYSLNFRSFFRVSVSCQSVCTRATWRLYCMNKAAYYLKYTVVVAFMHTCIVFKQGRDDSTLSSLRAFTYLIRVHPQPKRQYASAFALPSYTPKYYLVPGISIYIHIFMYTSTFLRAQLDLIERILPTRVRIFFS